MVGDKGPSVGRHVGEGLASEEWLELRLLPWRVREWEAILLISDLYFYVISPSVTCWQQDSGQTCFRPNKTVSDWLGLGYRAIVKWGRAAV